jgi:hypothetical protein
MTRFLGSGSSAAATAARPAASRPRRPAVTGPASAAGWAGHAIPCGPACVGSYGEPSASLARRKARLRLPALLVAVPPVRPFFAH